MLASLVVSMILCLVSDSRPLSHVLSRSLQLLYWNATLHQIPVCHELHLVWICRLEGAKTLSIIETATALSPWFILFPQVGVVQVLLDGVSLARRLPGSHTRLLAYPEININSPCSFSWRALVSTSSHPATVQQDATGPVGLLFQPSNCPKEVEPFHIICTPSFLGALPLSKS